MVTIDELKSFEDDIAEEFSAGRIRSPIHLGGGNESALIEIFKDIRPQDWVLAGWRSHFHCMLKGVPRDELKGAILAGHSVSLCFPKYKILCSGIVGGIAPIAVGLAWAIKRRREMKILLEEDLAERMPRVHCFLGDMSAASGIVHEAIKYANGYDLPVHWIIEDNGLSVCTDTKASWGLPPGLPIDFTTRASPSSLMEMTRYHYTLSRPHAGINRWVKF